MNLRGRGLYQSRAPTSHEALLLVDVQAAARKRSSQPRAANGTTKWGGEANWARYASGSMKGR